MRDNCVTLLHFISTTKTKSGICSTRLRNCEECLVPWMWACDVCPEMSSVFHAACEWRAKVSTYCCYQEHQLHSAIQAFWIPSVSRNCKTRPLRSREHIWFHRLVRADCSPKSNHYHQNHLESNFFLCPQLCLIFLTAKRVGAFFCKFSLPIFQKVKKENWSVRMILYSNWRAVRNAESQRKIWKRQSASPVLYINKKK